MKYHKLTKVQLPIYIDGDKQWLSFRFEGTVDKRRILREIRKQFKFVYGHSYKKEHFRKYAGIAAVYPYPERDTSVGFDMSQDIDVVGCWIEQFLKRENELADQNNGDPAVQADNPREAVV